MRRVGPPPDVFFVHHQLLRGVVHLAELRRRRQRHPTHTAGFSEQRRAIAYQPLLALALLPDQEHKQVGRRVAVQAQTVYRKVAGRQVQRLAPGFSGGIEVDQQCLLAVVVEAGDHCVGAGGACIEAAEVTVETRQFGALAVEQLQTVTRAGGEARLTVGQDGHGFGPQAGAPGRQGQIGGEDGAAGGQGDQQVQLGNSHERTNPSEKCRTLWAWGLQWVSY